jgi:hypothetical protein
VVVEAIVRTRLTDVSINNELGGSSPPSVFVGRYGYPKVSIGPASPPEYGDTAIYDLPESWVKLDLDDILTLRLSLIRGSTWVKINDVNDPTVLRIQEVAISSKPVDMEMTFEKAPKPRVILDEHIPPQGPSGPIKTLRIVGDSKPEKSVEKVYYDVDMRAKDAILMLYKSKIPISTIQKILSVGAMGTGNLRRLVPTRWSITAVDDIISKDLIARIKYYPLINDYLVFIRKHTRNLFIAILIPRKWSFEWSEAWFPGSTWNRAGIGIAIEGDWEGITGRTTYASIGGCYYASRLATTEYLNKLGRQATAILLREIYEGFNLPVGVWFVRENLRRMFKEKPRKFNEIYEALEYISKLTRVPIKTWIRNSYLLRKILYERSLTDYVKGRKP